MLKSSVRVMALVLALQAQGEGVNPSGLRREDTSCPPGVDTQLILQRGLVSNGDAARIQAVLAKARRGEPICVAAIGGSITAGGLQTKDPKRRYIQQLAQWFEKAFPGLQVRVVNAGIGATNSGYGALRVQRDVIAHQPDLVVVEYAVNDCNGISKLDDCYEGVLRQLLGSSTNRAVIELFFMHKDGKSAQPEQESLGRHYGLPMISFRDAVWPELQAGKLKWETIYADVVHPNDAGHDIAGELLRGFLNASLGKLPKNDRDLPAIAPVPAPLISDTFERCTMFRPADLKPLSSAGWTCVKSNVWECGSAGGRLEYEVPGTVLMLGRTIPSAVSKRVEVAIDGGAPRPVSREGHNLPVAKGLNAGLHRVAVVVHPFGEDEKERAAKIQIWWGGAAGL
jgi:lysophospholipase L1-like esterase